jgi:hypothetical protein
VFPRVVLLSLAALAGCQAESSDSGPKAPPAAIELREADGKVTARIVRGQPCRATVDGLELLVGTQPLVAQLGDVRWSGELTASGTLIRRNDTVVARVYPDDQRNEVGLYSADGIALFSAKIIGDKADLVSAAGAVVATSQKQAKGVKVGERTVTGTDDVLLAALLAAPDAPPEVRGLAACHRLFPPAKAAL